MWSWDEKLRESITKYDDNKYIVTGNTVTILYPKIVKKNNLACLSRIEILCYLHLIKDPEQLIIKESVKNRNFCDICGSEKDDRFIIFRFGNYSVFKCNSCFSDNKNQDLYINQKSQNDLIKDNPRYKIDITFLRDDDIVFLYRYVSTISVFQYEFVITKTWYGYLERFSTCYHCNRHPAYINSYCKFCYDFSYQLSQLNKIMLLSDSFDNDIFNNILYYYSNLINVSLDFRNILAVRNKCQRKIEIKEEIIENLYFSDIDYDESCDNDSTEFYESINEY